VPLNYFENREIETKSSGIIKRLLPVKNLVNMSELLEFFDTSIDQTTKSRMSKTIHHRNLLRNFRYAKPIVLENFENLTHLSIDFSENLTVPVKQEPQSLHWYKEQKTIHNVVMRNNEGKSYHPHFSDDLTKDQEFVTVSLREILDNTEIKSNDMLIIESDNCCNQYKSAKSFFLYNSCLTFTMCQFAECMELQVMVRAKSIL
jgi:hypothetical protein